MATVTVDGESSFEVELGRKLVLAIEDAGVDILHRCGGVSKCTTCRVQILAGDAGPMLDIERERLLRESAFGPDIRLSCQVRVEGDLSIKVLARASTTNLTPGTRPEE